MIIKFNQLCFLENPKCDNCEVPLEPFDTTIFYKNTFWCIKCFEEKIEDIENKSEIKLVEKEAKDKYLI